MGNVIALFIILVMAGLGFILSVFFKERFEMPLKKYKRIRIWVGLASVAVAIPSFILFFMRIEQDVSRFPFEIFIPLFIVGVIALGLEYAFHRCSSCDRLIRHRRGSWLYDDNQHCGHCGASLDS